jgi:glycoprotein-N-acetylgalactosamine 3-beta-galactosyltransferase
MSSTPSLFKPSRSPIVLTFLLGAILLSMYGQMFLLGNSSPRFRNILFPTTAVVDEASGDEVEAKPVAAAEQTVVKEDKVLEPVPAPKPEPVPAPKPAPVPAPKPEPAPVAHYDALANMGLVDIACRNPAVNLIKVATPEKQHAPGKKPPKILCFVLTTEENHDSRIRAIWDTWGKRCDKLVVASDANDPSLNAVNIKSKDGYWEIWHKLEKTLKYLHVHYRHEGFDWVMKADDDTYVVMENLKAFLANEAGKGIPQVVNRKTGVLDTAPMVYARTMPFPKLSTLDQWYGWLSHKDNAKFAKRFRRKFNMTDTLVYPHGGPGYIMNWQYVDILVAAFRGDPSEYIRGSISEDIANAVTMLYHDVRPFSTRDSVTGLERSHPESPEVMYENPEWLKKTQINIENTGFAEDCCSPSSISYHHIRPEHMRLLDYQVYECPDILASVEETIIEKEVTTPKAENAQLKK